MSREAIGVENLHFSYRDVPVLRGVDFTVEAGDFVAVIGSNGAGKSTLLQLLLGELQPDRGVIRLLGQERGAFAQWYRVGYVPQHGSALGDFPATAEEAVTLSLYHQIGPLRPMTRKYRKKALEALEQVEMRPFAGRMLGTLSGGQLQRVLIARALASGCELLFLDEPTTGVDDHSVHLLYQLLSRLNREQGLTVVMVTHDTARAAEVVGRALCLERGTVVPLDREQLRHELEHRHSHPHHGEIHTGTGGDMDGNTGL